MGKFDCFKDMHHFHEKSQIAEHFYGKSVFLTGTSGLLGQLYLEKLLRIGAKNVYVLLRPKKNVSPADRILKIIGSPVFEKLRKIDQHIEHRIKVINGDLSAPGLNIQQSELNDIHENVEFFIHSGADVRFNISLPEQILSNVRGSRDLFEIARKAKKLIRFVYVSTAYSHCVRDKIHEIFYEAPMDPEFWIDNAYKWDDDNQRELLDTITSKLIYPWPNTYTFSKALSEELAKRYGAHFPIVVIRPSIIISTHLDPIPGWTNNLSGMNGVMMGIGIGILRNLKMDPHAPLENICADYVTNGTFAAVWAEDSAKRTEPKIIQITQKGKHVTVGDLLVKGLPMMYTKDLYSMKCIWYPSFRFSSHAFESKIANICLHAIPAIILDIFNTNQIRLIKVARKIESLTNVLDYFTEKELYFSNDNMVEVQNRMSDYDKKLFASDTRTVDLLEFLPTFLMGLRVYIADDPLDTLAESMKKKRIQMVAHYTLKYTIWAIFLTVFYAFFCQFF